VVVIEKLQPESPGISKEHQARDFYMRIKVKLRSLTSKMQIGPMFPKMGITLQDTILLMVIT